MTAKTTENVAAAFWFSAKTRDKPEALNFVCFLSSALGRNDAFAIFGKDLQILKLESFKGDSKNFVIACIVIIGQQSATDTQTDRRFCRRI